MGCIWDIFLKKPLKNFWKVKLLKTYSLKVQTYLLMHNFIEEYLREKDYALAGL